MPDEIEPGPPPTQPVAPPPQGMGQYSAPPQPFVGQPRQDGPLDTLIPTSNPPSLVSYYCGVFSLTICFSPILAPISIIYGMKAMKNIKERPGLKGYGHALTGFILSGISLLILVSSIVLIAMSSNKN